MAKHYFQKNKKGVVIGVSIGFCVVQPNQIQIKGNKLITTADNALYEAKRGGKNKYYGVKIEH